MERLARKVEDAFVLYCDAASRVAESFNGLSDRYCRFYDQAVEADMIGSVFAFAYGFQIYLYAKEKLEQEVDELEGD